MIMESRCVRGPTHTAFLNGGKDFDDFDTTCIGYIPEGHIPQSLRISYRSFSVQLRPPGAAAARLCPGSAVRRAAGAFAHFKPRAARSIAAPDRRWRWWRRR